MAGSLVCLLASVAAPAAAQATITISDPQVTEGDGATTMTFLVTRNPALLAGRARVDYQTANGTARAPGDYTAAQGALDFPAPPLGLPLTQTQAITITIAGDTIPEPTEAFAVTLSGPEIVKGTGIGTIFDNDPLPGTAPGRSDFMKAANQQLISRTANGGVPNGDITEPTISGDSRIARYVAYTSTATNITAGTDGDRNVFLVKRGGSPGALGTPWKYGSTALVSRGLGGAAANGDSYLPALGGWTRGDAAKKPRCLGFVSQASNLVAGDSNGRADAFTRKLPSGKLKRVKTPAAVSEIAVSGDCRTFAVVAGGALYAKRSGKKLLKLAGGGASSPSLTYNGAQVGYAKNGKVLVRRVGGRAKTIASGANPSVDADAPQGKVRRVAYERGPSTYVKTVGGGERFVSPGSLPVMSAGSSQAMFAYGPYAYLYAVSNSFGKKQPQGFCPPDQGIITGLDLSARGNYSVLSCSGGAAYLFFLGGK